MKLSLAWIVVLAVLGAAACGGKSSSGGPDVTWTYDPGLTFKKIPSEEAAAVRKYFEGMSIVLVLHGDNSYELTIKGGPKPEVSSGSYKSTYEGVRLTAKTRDGKPVAADESPLNLLSDGRSMVIRLDGMPAELTRR